MFTRLLATVLSATVVRAHLAPWHPSMWAYNGVSGSINYNTDDVVHPLYQLSKNDWWFHGYNGVPNFPPASGQFLELPAGESFTVEIASNRGETSLSFSGKFASDWPDGNTYPEDYNVDTCITSPNMHTQNQTRAAGTAFAIAYTSDLNAVNADNLAVFTVRYHTPWKRLTSYDVPANMPACPSGGCICAWGWVPNGCGQPNMYMVPYRCKVTGATSTKAVGAAKAPVWCENNAGGCTSGPKQMIYWNQNEGNNIQVDGFDAAGDHKSPAYNAKCGFPDGAQNDIFTGSGASTGNSGNSGSTPTTSSTTPKATTTSTANSYPTAAKKVVAASSSSTSSAASASKSTSASASAGHAQCKTRKARRAEAALRKRSAAAMHRKRGAHAF